MPMQRMLVTLVVVLTGAVGVLAIVTMNLHAEVKAQAGRRPGDPARVVEPGPAGGAEAARVEALERQIAELGREVKRLRERPPAALAAPAGVETDAAASPAAEPGDQLPSAGAEDLLNAAARPRGADGAFLLTEEDEALFLALQKKVQERQRIEGMTRNMMRRIERLSSRGEIAVLDEHKRAQLEPILQRFMIAGDQLVSRYVRDPSPDVSNLTTEQRRDMVQAERDVLVEKAVMEMAPLLGDADALKVAEESLQNPWGLRFGRSRRGVDRAGD
jgi:hypothetical protein